jgi:ribokinase
MYDFITVGGATRDISFFTDQGVLLDNKKDIFRQKILAFESGAKIKVDKFYYSYGGGSANAAVCLSNLGLKVACLAPVGDDHNGRMIVENLKTRKIDISLIQKISKEESGSSFILIAPSGERIIFAQRGANKNLTVTNKNLISLKNTKNIYIASLAGNWFSNLRKIFSAVNIEKGQNIFWNPGMTQLIGGADKIKSYLKKTTVLACNEDEALALILNTEGYKDLDRKILSNVESLIKIIQSFGPKIVVVTQGLDGVTVFDGKKIIHRGIVKAKKCIDTTGVGDIFNSSFAAGWVLFNGNISKTIDLSLKNAAVKVTHIGAQNSLLKI